MTRSASIAMGLRQTPFEANDPSVTRRMLTPSVRRPNALRYPRWALEDLLKPSIPFERGLPA
jgi:hypothetical protein